MIHEDLQVQAFKALATYAASKKSLEGIMCSLCFHVCKHDGKKAFNKDDLVQAVNFVLSGGDCENFASDMPQDVLAADWAEREPEKSAGPLSLQVLRVLSDRRDVCLEDVIGQILWRFRKAEVFQDDDHMRMAAKDLSWIDSTAAAQMPQIGKKPNEVVEAVFREHAQENGRMNERSFMKVMDFTFRSYVTDDNGVRIYQGKQCSFKRTDCNHFFFAQAHQNGNRDVSCSGFKTLLLNMAERMEIHPTWLFMSIGGEV